MTKHPYLADKSRVNVTKNVRKNVSRLLKKMQPAMHKGQKGFSCDESHVEKIIQAIRSCKGFSTAHGINFFAKIVDYGNRHLDWTVPTVPKEALPLFNKLSISTSTFEDYLQLEKILTDFYEELESPIPATAEERILQIFFSAVTHGSLLDKRWIKPFLRALSMGVNVRGDWLWLELEGEPGSRKDCTSNELHAWHKHKRWVADPLTHFLIVRWFDKFPNDRKTLKKVDIQGAIKRCPFLQKHPQIRTVGSLLKLSKARANHLLLPSFLVDYAAGGLSAVCLNQHTWTRIVDNRRVHYPQEINDADLEPMGTGFLKSPLVVSKEFEPDKQVALLQRLLSKKSWEKIKQGTEQEHRTDRHEAQAILNEFLEAHRGDLSQTFILLIEWAKQLLNKRKHLLEDRRTSKPLAVSTVKTYLYNIGDGLLKHSCNLNLLELKALDREMVYEKAIMHKKTSSSRFSAAKRLEQFHGFIQVFYKQNCVDFDSIRIELGLPPRNVNARIMTPAEYRKVLAYLGWGQQHLTRRQTNTIGTCILGFKAGMRRSEIASTRLVDFQDSANPIIQIRKNEFNHTKSPESVRQIPLAPLLDADELLFVRELFAYRMRESQLLGDRLFFCDPSEGLGQVSYGALIGPIVDAMRAVTGDPKLSFHHMRHSFVTWSLFRLLLRDDITLGSAIKCLDDPFFNRQELKKFRLALLENERLGRNYLYAVNTLVGHATASTTICSYCHLLDLLLGYRLRTPFCLPELSVKAIQEVAEVSQAQAYKFKARKYNLADILKSVSRICSVKSSTEIKPLRGRVPQICIEEKSDFLLPWETTLTKFLNIVESKPEQSKLSEWTKPIPEDKSDILLAAKLYQRVSELDGRIWPRVHRALSLEKYSYDGNCASLIIKDPRLGKELIDILALLEVEKEDLSLIFDPNPERSKRSQKIDLKYWARGLGIDIDHLEKANLSPEETSGRGRALLKMKKFLGDQADENSEDRSSEALIFLMGMLEIGKLKAT